MLNFLKRTNVWVLIGAWAASALILAVLQSSQAASSLSELNNLGGSLSSLDNEAIALFGSPVMVMILSAVGFAISLGSYWVMAYIVDAIVRESGPKQVKLVFKLFILFALINSLVGYTGFLLAAVQSLALLGLFVGLYGIFSVVLFIFAVIWVKDIYNVSWVRSLFGQILAYLIYIAIVSVLTAIVVAPVTVLLAANAG
jgi:hypothetical protein